MDLKPECGAERRGWGGVGGSFGQFPRNPSQKGMFEVKIITLIRCI